MAIAPREEGTLQEKLWQRPDCPVPMNGEASVVGAEIVGLTCTASGGTNFMRLPRLGCKI
ncbi:MAG: hypothetical protein GY881_05535 [Gammaproteobacteria bacterium]|nr:hypothetical protein [Gammaproteobacteria bacterium]